MARTSARPRSPRYLALRRADGMVLLAERANTGYADGWYNLPSGKLEDGETIHHAAIREAQEEGGVRVSPDDLQFVTVVHHRWPEGHGRVGFFFQAHTWQGEPVNAEPDKCAGLIWADPAAPPPNTWPYTRAGLTQLLPGGIPYVAHGWEEPGTAARPDHAEAGADTTMIAYRRR